MRRLALVAVVGLALVGVASANGSRRLPSFLGCNGTHAAVRPHSILVACADGNYYLGRLTWSSWTTQSAAATGVAHVNDCTPNCAAGHFHAYPGVSVQLHRPESCTRGTLLFTRIEWRYTGQKPHGIERSAHERAPFWSTPHCP